MEPRTTHYKLFQFDCKNTPKYPLPNPSSSLPSQDPYPYPQPTIPIRIDLNPNDVPQYELNLIEGELRVMVFEEGVGRYPDIAQWVEYRKRVYWDGGAGDLGREIGVSRVGVGENLEPIQMILSVCKVGFKARAFLGPKFSKTIMGERLKDKQLIVQIQVTSISQYPTTDDFYSLTKFHNEILINALEGDKKFSNRDLQGSLSHYEKAIGKIFSSYYINTLTRHKKVISKQQRETLRMLTRSNNRDNQMDQLNRNKEIASEMEQISQKIALKGTEVALLAGEWFKVIKWARLLMVNPQYEYNVKLLIMRARAFAELEQYQRAEFDLKQILNLSPDYQIAKQQLQNLYQRKSMD